MPDRFPLTAVALTGDPFCEDGFCGDPIVPVEPPEPPDLPNANVYGFYSPTSTTLIKVYGGWSGNRSYFSPCTPNNILPSSTFGTATVVGVLGFRVVQGPAGVCGGYFTLNLQVQNAAGTWISIAGIGGGATGWLDFIGILELSTSASDATPVTPGSFGGTSAPP
jgi:hypothetical protein